MLQTRDASPRLLPALGASCAAAACAFTNVQGCQWRPQSQARAPGFSFTACVSNNLLSAGLQAVLGSLVRAAFLSGPAQVWDYINCKGCCLTTLMMKVFSPISHGNFSCCLLLPRVLSPCPSIKASAFLGSLERSAAGPGPICLAGGAV